MNITCPYCNEIAKLKIFNKVNDGNYYELKYICSNYPVCDSYVGADIVTKKPFGRLANKELRYLIMKANAIFDEICKRKLIRRRVFYNRRHARASSYRWLSTQLGIRFYECNISMFDVDMCKRVIEICLPYLKDIEYD